MTEGVRTADDVWREIQSKCRQHLEAKPPSPILTYEGVENFITGVGDNWIERHSTSRRAVRENSRTPKSDVVKIWESLVRNGHTDEVRVSYYFSFALVHRLIGGVSANGASQLYFSDRDKAMQTFESVTAPALPVREQLLADLRAVQTGWHAAEVSTGAVEPEPATEGQMAGEQVAKAGRAIVADYLAAAPVGSGGTIRQQFPQPGELRNAAFKAAKADCVARLADLGLTYPKVLPVSVARSLDEAERFFLAAKVTAPAGDVVAAGVEGIDHTVAAGVALVDGFWDASAQARVDHPEPGPERNAAFKAGHALMSAGLTALGLPVKATQALPASRPKAMIEVERRFREFLAAEGLMRPRRQRWLHKPLLLLVCFGRCAHKEGRMVRFAEIEEELTELLMLYDPPGSSASEPFWRLQYDGSLWVLEGQKLDELRASASPPTAIRLRDHLVSGGLSKPYYDAVVLDRSLLSEAVNVVITTFLPEAKWAQIRDHFGFPNPGVPTPVVEPGMTIGLAMDESKQAFGWAQTHLPKGQARNEAFAAQAQILLDRLDALRAIVNGELVATPEEIGTSRYKDLVDYVRMSRKNIELAERRYGWTSPDGRP